jgi:Tfp pilus assembly protein PilP
MMDKRRIGVIVGAVVLVVGVVAGRERPTMEIIESRAPSARVADDGIDLERLRRGEATTPQNDPFSRKNSGSEPRAAAANVVQPQPKPTAPPLPFKFFGRLTENGKTEVYVLRGDELLTIAAGQNIGDYRVEQIEHKSIAFTYLPLKTKQTLDIQ